MAAVKRRCESCKQQRRHPCFCRKLAGKRLVTYQTDANGQPVNQILLKQRPISLKSCISVPLLTVVPSCGLYGLHRRRRGNRKSGEETPHLIHKVALDPLTGPMPIRDASWRSNWVWKVNWFSSYQNLHGPGDHFPGARPGVDRINPLVITKQGDLICLDGKLGLTATHCSASLICAKCVTSRRRSA